MLWYNKSIFMDAKSFKKECSINDVQLLVGQMSLNKLNKRL